MHTNNIVYVLIIQAEICGKMIWLTFFDQILYSLPQTFRNLQYFRKIQALTKGLIELCPLLLWPYHHNLVLLVLNSVLPDLWY